MKYDYKKILFLIISVIVLLFSINLFFGKKELYSPNENRFLTSKISFSFKKLFDGSFIKDIENYLTDQFPLRNKFLTLNTNIERMLGKEDINNVYISKEEYLLEKYNKPTNNDNIIKVLNEFYKNLNYVNINLMLVPTSIEINKNLLPNNAPTYNQKETIDYIYKEIDFDTINVLDTLNKNNKDYQMFYRLDHHWTTYGAYYAYVEFAKHNNINPIKLSKFDIEEVTKDFNGTLYSKSNYYKYQSDKIHKFTYGVTDVEVNYVFKKIKKKSLYEEKYLTEKDKYSYFLDNNHPLIQITNNKIKNGKELLVLKDSYANCFIPFLINHYEKIHIIDPRFYKFSISEYVKENKNIKDTLILYNINTMDTDTGILSIK